MDTQTPRKEATTRLEARGPRGEACIVVRTLGPSGAPDGADAQYRLATGERLKPGTGASEFVTIDGKRTFKVY